jgi:integrase
MRSVTRAPLPGWRRYRCGACRYQREVFGVAVAPDFCAHCGAPWVSATVGLHSLRHTFASTLLMAGRTAPEVAKLCGHAGPDVTNRVYAHWLKGDHHTDALDALAGAADVVANGSK